MMRLWILIQLQGDQSKMKTLKEYRERVVVETPVDGVAAGSLEGDKHLCASKIMHKEWKEGTPIHGEHSAPDEFGRVSSYSVMFEHGIETVDVNDSNVEILEEGPHMNHKKKY
jgi:hypothetical protein